MNRTEYKKGHRKITYDRIDLTVPKGHKDKIKNAASSLGISVNEYLFMLVCDDLASGEQTW